ncbi:transglycosylase SLT domain-containing protein [Aquabacterium sp.]|uniref:transglycosylase SLT domain-containing protein n=1 Tax=Aquabacterium sp. TaxID=1872578 RepID=UPI002487C238|nr:transglycosylase SLT domain-containing protein [Aquabacterium sp.]MDI1258979.1 transglycosylase SLT domain-containing protein [Aquabacterium sp.]
MSIKPTLRPIALCAALLSALLFAGCSSLDFTTSQSDQDGASKLARATTASAMAAVTPSAPTAKSQTTQADALQDDAREAVGTPTDPLRPDTTLNLDDVAANQDLWARVRRGFGLPELDIALVGDHERWYSSRPDYVQRMTERSSRYLFHVLEEIERRQMPTELALLPFIESAFNPQAQSSARASGIWQFMPATGKDFRLKQNVFRDDRRDVLASTRAALDYLQRLNRQFGDWHLALAAYNWGEGNVQKAINRNIKAGLPTDYLSLNMPAETRNYVPKLHAVRNIVQRPDSFGLILTPIENHPYFVSVPIQRDMDVSLAAKLAGLSTDAFKDLNPSMNKPVILAAGTPQVLLPYDNASQFVHNLGQHKGLLATWTAWTVPRTMRPAEAAKQVGMSEATLRDINRIPPKMLVKVGSTLLVPRSQHREQDVSETVADNAMMALAPDLPPLRRMTLRAGKGDSVASLARRYRVSAEQVAQWNRVSASSKFKRGQSVVVYVPAGKKVQKSTRTLARASSKATVKVASASRTGNRAVKGRSTTSRASRVRVASAR